MNMIEKVARAIARYEACTLDDDVDCGSKIEECRCRNIAKAAIEAMREPTAGMKKLFVASPESPKVIWNRIIDAALKEG